MYRVRALRRFKRYYFHGLRNGMTSEEAADDAMTKTKKEITDLIAKDAKIAPGIDAEETWGDILVVLFEWQLLLINIPVDTARLTPKVTQNITENPDKSGGDGGDGQSYSG
jgi:hypothetical protein